jgi:hypothetical protein
MRTRHLVLIAGAVVALGFLAAGLAYVHVIKTLFVDFPTSIVADIGTPPDAPATPERIAFLADADLADGTALVLWPAAYSAEGAEGPEARVVRDTAALRRVADQVWVQTDDAERTRMLLLSVVFMSPPGTGVDQRFASIVRADGSATDIGVFSMTRPIPSDLAGLIDLSAPAALRTANFDTAADIAAFRDRLASDPGLVLAGPLPDPALLSRDVEADLMFPSILRPSAAMDDTAIRAEETRLATRFADLFGPAGGAYDAFQVEGQRCDPPMIGPLGQDTPRADGPPWVPLPGWEAASFGATLRADDALPDTVNAGARDFAADFIAPPELDAALVAALRPTQGEVNPDDWQINLDCWNPRLTAFWPREIVASVPYLEALPGGAP